MSAPPGGQLGNALKCVWAAPYVADGQHGRVEVSTGGLTYQIDVTLDQIAQQPTIAFTKREDAFVKSGTCITLHWPGIASALEDAADLTFYNVADLLHRYAAFNPHGQFQYVSSAGPVWRWRCTTPAWAKWRPQQPTSPHWYTVERFQALLAAYLAEDRRQGRVRTVRAVVAEFAGLTGTAAQKAVTADAGVSGASLDDLVVDGGMDVPRVRALLKAMQARSRLIKPAALGVIGDTHLWTVLVERFEVAPDSITYKKSVGEVEGVPYVVELACGWYADWDGEQGGTKLLGVNWTPALRPPFACLADLLDEAQVDAYDPVVLAIHLAYPRVEVTDRGKSAVALPVDIIQGLAAGVTAVTKPWRALKRQADHTRRVRFRDIEYWRKQ
jgi:DNA topoisomerase VI subunit B